jgi:hypothetical protein
MVGFDAGCLVRPLDAAACMVAAASVGADLAALKRNDFRLIFVFRFSLLLSMIFSDLASLAEAVTREY